MHMKKMINSILVIALIGLFLAAGCINDNSDIDVVEKSKIDYNKCTAVCSAIVGDDFVTLNLCMEECKKKFLESD